MGAKDEKTKGDDTKDNVHGEGNYEASRQYNKATKAFVESGRVEEAARDAAPADEREAADLKAAEEAGLERAKGKDIARKEKNEPSPTPSGKPSQNKISNP